MRYYLAYGSNLNLPLMQARCPSAAPLGTTKLHGWRLAFRGRDSGFYLTIEPAPERSVPAVVWSVNETDELALDLYEDYPIFYYKQSMNVICQALENGQEQKLEAFAYVMRDSFQPGLPTEDYMDACLEGYRSFRFDTQLLWEAKAYSEDLHATRSLQGGNP